MIRLNYYYQNQNGGEVQQGTVSLAKPELQQDPGLEDCWGCLVEITGLEDFKKRIFGEDALQAFELALLLAVKLLTTRENYDVWRWEKGDNLAVSIQFSAPHE